MTDEGGPATTERVGARRGRTTGDMVRSLLIVLAVVAALVILVPQPNAQPAPVDWRPAAERLRASADYDVLVPEGLTADWRATNARVEPAPGAGSASWRVTFVTPAKAWAALAQSDGDVRRFAADMSKKSSPVGSVTLSGDSWQRLFHRYGEEERRTLMRRAGPSVVLVTGTAGWAELETLAGALQRS